MDKERLGQRIREERKRHRYTLEALATKARIGSVYLSEIESLLNNFAKELEKYFKVLE